MVNFEQKKNRLDNKYYYYQDKIELGPIPVLEDGSFIEAIIKAGNIRKIEPVHDWLYEAKSENGPMKNPKPVITTPKPKNLNPIYDWLYEARVEDLPRIQFRKITKKRILLKKRELIVISILKNFS